MYSSLEPQALILPSCHQTNPEFEPERCFAFVHDLSDVEAKYPIPDGTLDVIVLIFVLSGLHPNKYELLPLSTCHFRSVAVTECSSGFDLLRFITLFQDAGIHQQISTAAKAGGSDAAQGLWALRHGTAPLQERYQRSTHSITDNNIWLDLVMKMGPTMLPHPQVSVMKLTYKML